MARIVFPAWVCTICYTAWSNYMSQCPRCTVIAGIEYFSSEQKLINYKNRLQEIKFWESIQ